MTSTVKPHLGPARFDRLQPQSRHYKIVFKGAMPKLNLEHKSRGSLLFITKQLQMTGETLDPL